MEEKINEAREQFNAILDYVLAAATGSEIAEVEISIHRMVLSLGKLLLELFVLSTGTGKTGMTLVDHHGRTYRYLRDSPRDYMSLFGEIVIPRAYYYREGQEGLFPLDSILNLPKRKYSYPLQDKMAHGAVKESYEATSASIEKDLYLNVAHRPIQEVARDCTAVVEEFMDSLEPPSPETEGPILVHTVDCKGIKMRPGERNVKQVKTEEKPGEKLMACVAQTYSIHPHFRPEEAIADTFFGPAGSQRAKEKDPRRPKPLSRRTFVSLKDDKSELFRRSTRSASSRVHAGTEEKLGLMDGEIALKNRSREFLPDWSEVLDITHAVERLRTVGQLQFGNRRAAAREYGRDALLCLLGGKVGDVIEDFHTILEDEPLSDAQAKELNKALGYYRNNQYRMDYDRCLAKGLPIASGVIESMCNSLINIRMDGPGMFWSVPGAEAILKLRGVFLDDLWEEFWAFRATTERKRLYAKYDNIRPSRSENQKKVKAA